MLDKLRKHYDGDEQKARIAMALVLWRNKPVEEIRQHIDGEFGPLFAEVLSDRRGATFFWKERDSITLNRWARLLLHEGVDSKSLNPDEEQHLFNVISEICGKFRGGLVTQKDVRNYGELGNGHGAESLSSRILKKWEREGRLALIKRGQYKLVSPSETQDTYEELLELFTKK
jgi:hypothetical protein